MILQCHKMLFVTDKEDSDQFIENLRTEYGTRQYRIKIDRTMRTPYYELFLEFKEGKRTLNERLFASSNIDKIVNFINEKL